jgi:hypothetical protein
MFQSGQSSVNLAIIWGIGLLITTGSIVTIYNFDILDTTGDTRRCTTSDRAIHCDQTKATAVAAGENSTVEVPLANQENTALNIQNPRITSVNGEDRDDPCSTDQAVIDARSETTISCDNVNASITAGTTNTITLTVTTSSVDTAGFATNRTITTTLTPRDPDETTVPTAPENLAQLLTEMTGSGTPGNPYIITNVEELQAMDAERDAHYKLGNDIDASDTQYWNNGSGFKPVATYSNRFEGSLDGDGKTISNLYVNNESKILQGLFNTISPGGKVHDFNMIDVDITGYGYTGALAGVNTGTVRDITIQGDIDGAYYVGGAIGIADGYPGGTPDYGYNGIDENSSVKRVSTNVDIIHNNTIAGGVVGYGSGGPYFDLSAEGTIFSNYTGYGGIGGTIGYGENGAQIRRNQADVDINATANSETGGLVGFLDVGHVKNGFATGNVIGDTNVGGLVGTNDNAGGNIEQAYAQGDVTGNQHVGGLVGENEDYADIHFAYATGNVTGNTETGGVIGRYVGPGPVEGMYWDVNTTGQDTSPTNNATGLATPEMQGSSAEGNMSELDFTSNWQTTSGYPELAWE